MCNGNRGEDLAFQSFSLLFIYKRDRFPQFPCLFLSVYFCVCVLSRSLDARGNPEGWLILGFIKIEGS